MSPEAVELDIHIHNDFQLWKQHEAVESNLAKKIVKGIYNPELAIKAWLGLVDRAARSYAKDNSMPSRAFDSNLRRELATEFERRFYKKHMGMRKSSDYKLSQDMCSYAGCTERRACAKCQGCKTHHKRYGCSAGEENVRQFVRAAEAAQSRGSDRPGCTFCGSLTHASDEHDGLKHGKYEVGEDWL